MGSTGNIRAGTTNAFIFKEYALVELLPQEMMKVIFAIVVVWAICLIKLGTPSVRRCST